ncbi:MAG: hypothetical protein KF794_11350 [Xanthobacteraceae bacterium]|nr:hypothetical protein [Xanthobacteraceae bacterium]QYK44366.1 MAG: hypothetical protein KF794_11350 [Xanthobacteraceae bacterium]
MRRLAATAALLLLSGVSAPGFENELLGRRDVDVPDYQSQQGALLIDGKGVISEFAIDYGQYKKNFVILLQKDTGARTKADAPVFEIVQVIRAPKPKGLDMYSVGCFLKPATESQDGQYVFAYAAFNPNGQPRAIKGAWMFDWDKKQIVAVPEGKVDCREPGD